ncbi:MAG: peptidoglycan DD-metalloendopeptidase family protein [Clostridia bacterium]|nr:peptidoglycan DD-metalloendopeptidase family protein [Clostridia bacterium]
MKKRRIKVFAVSLLILGFTVSASAGPLKAASSSSVAEKENALSEIQGKIDSYNDAINQARTEINGAYERKEKLDEEILLVEKKIEATNELISVYDTEIQNKNSEMIDMDTAVDDKYEGFKSWLRTMQVFGNYSYLDMIMSSETFVEFLENVDRLGTLIEYQNSTMDELRDDISMINMQKQAIDTLREEQLEVKNQMEADNARLQELRTEAENYIAELKKNEEQYEKYLEEALAAEEELGNQIASDLAAIAAEEERQRQAEESRRLAEESRRAAESNVSSSSNGNGGSGGSTEPPIEPPVSSGDIPSFTWPVEGKYIISTTYGYARPGETSHRGIDIPAPHGTNIYAIESGTVITAGYHGSFGNYLIVNHGNGYASLYAHCSKLYVSEGQAVSRGECIAAVGTTGNSYGNHLHLETYINGVLTDPLQFYAYMSNQYSIQIYG